MTQTDSAPPKAPPNAVAKSVPDSPTAIAVRTAAPFAVGVFLWRDDASRVLATVVAKATYRLTEGTSELVEPPDPIRDEDEYWHGDAAGRLRFPSDLAPFKAGYEVLVIGRAPSAGGTAFAGIEVGSIDKSIEIHPGDDGQLVGFGAVSRSWPQRDSLLRPEDREWLRDPIRRPRPRAFDPAYFCTAPADQRSREPLRSDQRVVLDGLAPSRTRLTTRLPGVAPRLRSVAVNRPVPPFVADTLCIDTDRRVATLTFRAIVPLDDERLFVEVTAERESSPGRGDDATTELDRNALGDMLAALPFPPASDRGRAPFPNTADGALPFRASTPPPGPMTPTEADAPAPTAAPQPPRSTVGQLQFLSHPPSSGDARPPKDPPPVEKDRFRKAFGAKAHAATPPSAAATPTTSSAPEPTGTVAQRTSSAPMDASGGAKAASDGALMAAMKTVLASPSPMERATASITRRAVVDLLSFDGGVPARLRRSKTHASLLVDADASRAPRKVDAPVKEQPEDRARVDVLRVLSCGAPLAADELDASFDALLDDPNDLDIPLFLVAGDVRPTMDEIERLKVAAEIAKPLAGSNARVLAALAAATEALGRAAQPMGDAALSLYKRLETATGELPLPPRHLADVVDRTLLEARSFKRRTLLGGARIRADLAIGKSTFPIYLPDDVASHLPLLPVFPGVALVEFRPREDASEPTATALVAFAIGRVLRSRKQG